jgi:hypothetical protein
MFCARQKWPELVHKHNDPGDSYHLRLFEIVVIGCEVKAEHDVVRINFLLALDASNFSNSLCTIIAVGWGFQLKANVTDDFGLASVDLVEFGVDSIPCQNNVLCLFLIQKGT